MLFLMRQSIFVFVGVAVDDVVVFSVDVLVVVDVALLLYLKWTLS